MSTSERVAELKAIVSSAMEEIHEIELAENVLEAEELIGKCFKRQNSYGTSENWWKYFKIIGQREGQPLYISFEVDCDGDRINIEELTGYTDSFTRDGSFIEIGDAEFSNAFHELIEDYVLASYFKATKRTDIGQEG